MNTQTVLLMQPKIKVNFSDARAELDVTICRILKKSRRVDNSSHTVFRVFTSTRISEECHLKVND